LAEHSERDKKNSPQARKVYEACPHCGHELSPWQQVLLSIDRALVCKNCWYRIILDTSADENRQNLPLSKNKE
jgi:DNA-directed RNA polymerase subunit RPC12/RpoP